MMAVANDAEDLCFGCLSDTLQLLLALFLLFICSLVDFRHGRWPFLKVFKRCPFIALVHWSSWIAGWNSSELLYLRHPVKTGLAAVGLDKLSCLKLCFQLILMSVAFIANKFCWVMLDSPGLETWVLQARRHGGGVSLTDGKHVQPQTLTHVSPQLHKKCNSF